MAFSLVQKLAIALKYKHGVDPAPMVIASGRGFSAETLLRKAREHNVPIHEDEALSRLLIEVEEGQYIPEELFDVVAQVVAMVYRMDESLGRGVP